MSPNDDNSAMPGGLGGTSPFPSPVDFTNPSALNTTSSLSMSDTLSSAEDSLTSAGQAANLHSGAVGLDQLDLNSNATTTLSTSDMPLRPAPPVPGSIGSVTSVPPLQKPDLTTDALGTSNTSSASVLNGAPVASAPVAAPVTTSNMPSFGNTASASTNTSTPAAPETSPASTSGYYNPFAQPATPSAPTMPPAPAPSAMPDPSNMMGVKSPASSTAVPPALQPQSEKFSKAAKKSGGVSILMAIIPLILAVVLGILAIIFFMLWQDAEKRVSMKDPTPPASQEPVQQELAILSCVQEVSAEEAQSFLDGLASAKHNMTASYLNNKLNRITIVSNFGFNDEAAAEAAQWYFDGRKATYVEIAENLGIKEIDNGIAKNGANVDYTIAADADQLNGEYVSTFMLDVADNGEIKTSLEDVQKTYEAENYVCSVE